MELLKRQDLVEGTVEEMNKMLLDNIDQLKQETQGIKDVEELKAREQVVIDAMEEYDNYLKGVEYELAEETMFMGTKYKRADASKKIVYFLNKIEVAWEYTMGMHQLVQFWKSQEPKAISYGAYDSTLRTLNQNKFKGDTEWLDILIVNDYLKGCHDIYTRDTSYMLYLSSVHNDILDQIKMVSPLEVAAEYPEDSVTQ